MFAVGGLLHPENSWPNEHDLYILIISLKIEIILLIGMEKSDLVIPA